MIRRKPGGFNLSKRKPNKRVAAPAPKKQPIQPEQPASPKYRRVTLIVGGIVGIICCVAAVLIYTRPQAKPSPASVAYTMGSVQYCLGDSSFVRLFGFTQGGSAFDTRANFVKGVALRELDADGAIIRSYEHPSWSRAGYLGSFQRDKFGNIFLIPVPFIGIMDNPPQQANIIHRIDSVTGVMAPLVNLPVLAPVTPQNVYGLLNLTYDCDTNSLYASSVFGSTYDNVAGCIFQIDPNTGEVKSSLERIDAFGVGVFNSAGGKRLYFGMARTPEIYSVALDDEGKFTSDIRPEPSLANAGIYGDKHARSFAFQQNQLVVKSSEFDFNLAPQTENQQTYFLYTYDVQQDTWQFVGTQDATE